MVRVKRATYSKKKKKRILKQAKGYRGAKSRRLRTAKEQVMHAKADSFAHRRKKKSDFRKIWISRINAAARQEGMSYSQLIAGLKKAGIDLNRKMLADMAVNKPDDFSEIVSLARQAS